MIIALKIKPNCLYLYVQDLNSKQKLLLYRKGSFVQHFYVRYKNELNDPLDFLDLKITLVWCAEA